MLSTVPRTLKLTIAYDGTEFAGWQMQAGQRTVQGALEDALTPIDGERVVVHSAGRTDSGVHAAPQVISFRSSLQLPATRSCVPNNNRLPKDVRVMDAQEAADGFNARFDARHKTYHYVIFTGAVVPPQIRHFVWHVPQALDVRAINEAAAALLGEHDFSAFQAAGGDVITTRREFSRPR